MAIIYKTTKAGSGRRHHHEPGTQIFEFFYTYLKFRFWSQR